MLIKMLDKAMKPIAKLLQYNYMHTLGVNDTMKLARAFNCFKFRKYYEHRRNQYLNHFDELIRVNGLPTTPLREIRDGWALDTSGTLPHLKQLLADADEIIKERGGVKRTSPEGRSYFQEIPVDDLLVKYPSILDFATSSDVLSVICSYLGFIPVFSSVLPYGIRFNESWAKFDDNPDGPLRASQLFHLDFHDSPMAYVIVALRDVTMQNGPFCFLPASISQKASKALNYGSRGRHHQVSDEEIYSVVSESELIKFCYPAGTVLFLDNSKCFHYGSRKALKPRYLILYAYLSPCKTNFGDLYMSQKTHPIRDSDSRLRKMVLNREFME
jgi:hypothetical protein